MLGLGVSIWFIVCCLGWFWLLDYIGFDLLI